MATIKLSDSVLLDSSSVKIGIDMSNVLASNKTSYTAAQDCWCYLRVSSDAYHGERYISLDGGIPLHHYNRLSSDYTVYVRALVFVKKGQKLTGGDGVLSNIDTVYGTK